MFDLTSESWRLFFAAKPSGIRKKFVGLALHWFPTEAKLFTSERPADVWSPFFLTTGLKLISPSLPNQLFSTPLFPFLLPTSASTTCACVRVRVCSTRAYLKKAKEREKARECVLCISEKRERDSESGWKGERLFRKNQRPRKSSKNLSLAHQTHSLLCLIFTPKKRLQRRWNESRLTSSTSTSTTVQEKKPIHTCEKEREGGRDHF